MFKELQAPLGISFIVFHGISYIFDIFKDSRRFRSDFLQTCLFLSFFPKILAGPIFRYNEALEQLEMRTISFENFAYGAERFIIGLGKKLLLANALAKIANPIFEAPYTELGAGYAWLGAICYTLQIYYDFSGYTDMAVGVGYMFGFKLPENFQYPYSAQSIREFWQKWHITLSTWFREYLYIPLGGNRFGAGRTYFNLAVVFFLCGLWHGANWTFIIWGLFHGFFLILERMGLSGLLKRLPVPFRHLYLLVVIVFSWVFFRSTNLENALGFSGAMLGIHQMPQANPWILLNINVQFWVVLTVAILFSFPLFSIVRPGKTVEIQSISHKNKLTGLFAMKSVALSFLFIFSVIELASGSYNPFIYFKF